VNCESTVESATRPTLQHAATHHITPKHTTTHCDTLQHTGTYCNTLHCQHYIHVVRQVEICVCVSVCICVCVCVFVCMSVCERRITHKSALSSLHIPNWVATSLLRFSVCLHRRACGMEDRTFQKSARNCIINTIIPGFKVNQSQNKNPWICFKSVDSL